MPAIPFSSTLTIPAGTTVLAPEKQELNVVPGRIVFLRLYVPPGPRGEVSLWFKHQNSQLAPAPPKTWDNLDDDVLTYPLDYAVLPGETQFHLYGASPGANFEHAIEFELMIDTSQEQAAIQPPGSLTGKFLNALGLGS